MLNIAYYIVFALLLIVSSLLLLLVLMQRPKQEGLGASFGAQMTDQVFGAQTSDVLKKGTVLFGSLFMILCFTLSVLINKKFQADRSTKGTEDPTALKAQEDAKLAEKNAEAEKLSQDMLQTAPAEVITPVEEVKPEVVAPVEEVKPEVVAPIKEDEAEVTPAQEETPEGEQA